MLLKSSIALCCSLLLGGCAQLDAWTDTTSKRNTPAAPAAEDTQGTALFVAPAPSADVAAFRNIFIAPANLANMQVIQPEGAPADPEWWVTEEEDRILQRTIAYEFSLALASQADFTIVTSPQQAQLLVNTAVVAVHPDRTRAAVAKTGETGGSITVSVAVVNATSGAVLVRSVATRSSENIWAFNEVQGDDPVLNKVFAAWGEDLRRGILQLQGRAAALPVAAPL